MALWPRQIETILDPRPTEGAQPQTPSTDQPNIVTVPNSNSEASQPTTSVVPPYQYAQDKSLTGTCRLTNSTNGDASGLFSNPFRCEKLILASSVKQNTGAIAAAVVFALLFAATAGLLFLFWWRRRKINGTPIPPLELKDASNSNEVSSLSHQLALERRRVTDLQAALLSQSSGQPGGWSTSHPKDDRTVKRSFSSIFQEVRDLAGNYYVGGSTAQVKITAASVTGELKEVLEECISGWESMLETQKGRVMLVRIIVGELLRRSWVDHEFLGKKTGHAVTVLEREVVRGTNREHAHLWRVQTFLRVLAGMGEEARNSGVQAVADKIYDVLSPFRPRSASGSSSAGRTFLHNLVKRMADLYYELATQNAYYELSPYFSVTREHAGEDEGAVFEYASCDDVEQKWEVGTDAHGREWCAAEGRVVRGFVFPGVVKYGDGRGGGWEEGRVVVFKAQVLA
ncbi:hypothetical protein TWF106_007121 [Orbilia oligospora]|uniref:Uncharacterized protein n=1 Tax=Orbilia oligospora TaxID=2813651 RepID=A0A6G1M564_ORBOL|nr:hypothetical protein TWF679_008198 [Orbilia oligospora]KAF3219280.1 hypothetical protein TWF106_007121 [Orbilia oligospora]KAF3220518.1 hypothetical protein TWF191_007417 [Orbilia oligospora]KAF3244069.1 hypothetical protein TWF192_007875 [Orbilia oligospora]